MARRCGCVCDRGPEFVSMMTHRIERSWLGQDFQSSLSCDQANRVPSVSARVTRSAVAMYIENVTPTAHRRQRETSCDRLAVHRKITLITVKLVCAADRDAETSDDFIEDRDIAVSPT